MRKCSAVVLMLLTLSGTAAGYPTVYFEPQQVFVPPGETCSVGIRVDAGADTLTCFLVEISFNPGAVQLNAAEEGSLFAESGYSTMYDWDVLGSGNHVFNDVTLGFDAYVLCPGELVRLELEGVSEGTTSIVIDAVDLRDLRRDPILPVFAEPCGVHVGPETGADSAPDPNVLELRCSPNPFRSEARLEIDGCVAGPVDVSVMDVAGRIVARPATAESVEGRLTATWDGKDGAGKRLPAGVYFVIADGAVASARAKIVLLR